jgi:hypothetical protein
MGFTETMASRSDYINVNSDGTKDLPLSTGGAQLRYNSLWNFLPENKSEPGHAGVTLIWDARFSHERPLCSSTGRLAGVTLLGPLLQKLRVLVVYPPASPASCPKTVQLLHKHLLNEFSHARRSNTPLLILGDFNDVPSQLFICGDTTW